MATDKHIVRVYTPLSIFISDAEDNQHAFLSDNGYAQAFMNGSDQYLWAPNRKYSGAAFTYLDADYNDLTARGDMYAASNIYHYGDTDTYRTFSDDQITDYAGNIPMIDMSEGTNDEITLNPSSNDVDVIRNGQTMTIFWGDCGTGTDHFYGTVHFHGNVGINFPDSLDEQFCLDGNIHTYGRPGAGTTDNVYLQNFDGGGSLKITMGAAGINIHGDQGITFDTDGSTNLVFDPDGINQFEHGIEAHGGLNIADADEPSLVVNAGSLWYDSNTSILKLRNTDNDAWLSAFTNDSSEGTWAGKLKGSKIYPPADGTTALQITEDDASTVIANVDTVNTLITINYDVSVDGEIKASGDITAVNANLSALTDYYIPYHVNDSSGLANSPIRTNGTEIGFGGVAYEATGAGFTQTRIADNAILAHTTTTADGGIYLVHNAYLDTGWLWKRFITDDFCSLGLADGDLVFSADASDDAGVAFTPTERMRVSKDGNIDITGSVTVPITAEKTDDYTIAATDYTVRCNDTTITEDKTLTLPAASGCKGRIYVLHAYHTSATWNFIVDGNGDDTIDGAATLDFTEVLGMSTYKSITVQSDGVSDWMIIGHYYSAA